MLAHMFLSLAFATKSELGWDTSIDVFDDDGKRGYNIKVGVNAYRVLEVLSELGADAIIGRATRVFKVELNGEVHVLKDVWVEDGRELEHAIRDRLLQDVKRNHGKEKMDEVANYLLTPIDHWLVAVDGQEDHTAGVMIRGGIPPVKSWFKLTSRGVEGRPEQDNMAPMLSSDGGTKEKTEYIAKKFWRKFGDGRESD